MNIGDLKAHELVAGGDSAARLLNDARRECAALVNASPAMAAAFERYLLLTYMRHSAHANDPRCTEPARLIASNMAAQVTITMNDLFSPPDKVNEKRVY